MKRKIGPLWVLLLFFVPAAFGQAETTVRIDPAEASDWTVDRRIFGKFFEANGRDAYPGIYAQHLANGSFERWFSNSSDELWRRRSEVLYRDTESYEGLVYPWEPVEEGQVRWEERTGGVRGERYQRVEMVEGTGGLRQRVALPDECTLAYDVAFSVRGSADAVRVRLESQDGSQVFAEEDVPLEADWNEHTVRLELETPTEARYQDSPSGEYVLSFVAGEGTLDLDEATLIPADAVEGKYNPTTIEYLRRFNVTSLRWPGGNWASAYRWEDGVGPVEERPIRPEAAWGGLEPNYMGTAEFLEFCEIAGVEPLINVGFNEDIPPEEAARWVEYVNGSTDTEMGALRAKHGHPEPWNVKLWQVGNEVYGTYQIGHTDAEDFARRFQDYYDAMKAVDPEITVIAAGVDPLYQDWGANSWNETIFEVAGKKVEAVDIHRYVRGIVDDDNRADWTEQEYLQAMVAFPTQFEDIIGLLRGSAADRGLTELKINVGEWNLQAAVSSGWARPDYPTMAHASFVAGMYNVFIRQGDAVRYTYQRDNALYYRPYPADFRPPGPANYTLRFYAEPFLNGEEWHHLPLRVEGPTFDMRQAGNRQQPTSDVPYVDAAAVTDEGKERMVVYVTNRHLEETHDVTLELGQVWTAGESVDVTLQHAPDPFARHTSWKGPEAFSIEEQSLPVSDEGQVRLSLPPASVAKLELRVRRAEEVPEEHDWEFEGPHPNPFGRETSIGYTLKEEQFVRISIFNALGQKIEELVPGLQEADSHAVTWDAKGEALVSGLYFFRLETEQFTEAKPALLLR